MAEPRTLLRAALEAELLPFFLDRGFARVPLPVAERTSAGIATAFPFGRLQRQNARDLELVEVQFDKHGRPRFVINFGRVPEDGVSLPWGGHLDQASADVSALSGAHRLCDSRWREKWFAPAVLGGRSAADMSRLAARARHRCEEVEDWFRTGAAGAHMRRFGLG